MICCDIYRDVPIAIRTEARHFHNEIANADYIRTTIVLIIIVEIRSLKTTLTVDRFTKKSVRNALFYYGYANNHYFTK